MNQTYAPNAAQQLRHCEQLLSQLIQQTQQSTRKYQQMLQQEQQNVATLEQLAQRERQAVQIIQTALQGHQTALDQLYQASAICRQLESAVTGAVPAAGLSYTATGAGSFIPQPQQTF
jgi:uncharacterized membrane protein